MLIWSSFVKVVSQLEVQIRRELWPMFGVPGSDIWKWPTKQALSLAWSSATARGIIYNTTTVANRDSRQWANPKTRSTLLGFAIFSELQGAINTVPTQFLLRDGISLSDSLWALWTSFWGVWSTKMLWQGRINLKIAECERTTEKIIDISGCLSRLWPSSCDSKTGLWWLWPWLELNALHRRLHIARASTWIKSPCMVLQVRRPYLIYELLLVHPVTVDTPAQTLLMPLTSAMLTEC